MNLSESEMSSLPKKIKDQLLAKWNQHLKINPAPIVILGNQKSGTSAIAHLLAQYGGLSKTIDIPESWWPTLGDLLRGELRLIDFANLNKHRFSTDLIKEPNLTFLYSQLVKLHPQGTFVFVVRDPRSNIRSLLNRMELPGDRESVKLITVPETWRPIFDAEVWGLEAGHYIEILSARWNLAADVYLEHPGKMLLVRYEDFVADKTGTIKSLAQRLGLSHIHDISDKVDIQYQRRGNQEISWKEFFGPANLARIERICDSRMARLGYKVEG